MPNETNSALLKGGIAIVVIAVIAAIVFFLIKAVKQTSAAPVTNTGAGTNLGINARPGANTQLPSWLYSNPSIPTRPVQQQPNTGNVGILAGAGVLTSLINSNGFWDVLSGAGSGNDNFDNGYAYDYSQPQDQQSGFGYSDYYMPDLTF